MKFSFKNFKFILLAGCLFFFLNQAVAENITLDEPVHVEVTKENLDSSIDEALNNDIEEVQTPHVEDVQEMTPNANEKIKNEVVNDTNSHLKSVIKKFLTVMFAVVVSSVLIFVILLLMNRFNFINTKKDTNKTDPSEGEIPISNDENDALKIFFDKTK